MRVDELTTGDMFGIEGHPLGPILTLIYEGCSQQGAWVCLEKNPEMKAMIPFDTGVYRIYEAKAE